MGDVLIFLADGTIEWFLRKGSNGEPNPRGSVDIPDRTNRDKYKDAWWYEPFGVVFRKGNQFMGSHWTKYDSVNTGFYNLDLFENPPPRWAVDLIQTPNWVKAFCLLARSNK